MSDGDVRSELQALVDARGAVHERLMALPDDELYAVRHAVHEEMLFAQAELRVLTRLKNSLGKPGRANGMQPLPRAENRGRDDRIGVRQARRAIEDATRAIDDNLLGEAWTALENAQRELEKVDETAASRATRRRPR